MKSAIEILIAGCFSLVCVVVGYFLSNFILTKLWGWFVVPIFNVQQISMVQSMGLTLIIGYVLRSSLMVDGKEKLKKEFEDKSPFEISGILFGYAILSPLFVWFIGYIITLFL